LLVLFSASAALEEYATGRTRRAIDVLLKGAPKKAVVIDGENEREVPIEEIRAGDRIRVFPSQAVPVDARVVSGASACDESSLTGESMPVEKDVGDTISAGTLNLGGSLDAVALRPARESTLQKMIDLIERAQHLRAPSQRLADAFGTRYTGFVLVSCAGLFTWSGWFAGLPLFLGDATHPSAFYRAMTLLVVMSPCALVLSVPSAILSAIASAARRGVLFRGGSAIERLAAVAVIAMDKTGTLTEGNLRLESVDLSGGSEDELLSVAAALARFSTHPLSRAVTAAAHRRGLRIPNATNIESVTGNGMRGLIDGCETLIGRRQWLVDRGLIGPATATTKAGQVSEVWISAGPLSGRLVFRDSLRAEAAGLLSQLHARGLRTVMLTGDHEAAAREIALASGVGEFRAGLRPEEKVQLVEEFKRGGQAVAMIGDGVNDAACLAAADVGVAMGARGSDAAIEQADVILMNDRLEKFLVALSISERARRIIRQNLIVSLGVMAVMAVVAIASQHLPLAAGVAMHEGSTALVVLNGLRLLFGGSVERRKSLLPWPVPVPSPAHNNP
jgi:Zn2+/Cd2+-exporting ATPase